MCLIGVYLIGVYLMGVYLIVGVYLRRVLRVIITELSLHKTSASKSNLKELLSEIYMGVFCFGILWWPPPRL